MVAAQGKEMVTCMDELGVPGRLLELAEKYIGECAEAERVVNIAGFCRYLGISAARLRELTEGHPEQAGLLMNLFEDEALNSGLSPSLLTSYLKNRLGYGEERQDGVVKVTFRHDIMKDGE